MLYTPLRNWEETFRLHRDIHNLILSIYCLPFYLQGAQLRKHIDATLGSGNLREAVRLPPGEDINEWLAVNSNVLQFPFLP